MTKKQLEKQRKEFNEFVANVEKMGGRFLTEDELRYKINGGGDAPSSDDDEKSDGGGQDEIGENDGVASAPSVESTGSGENAPVTEPEENKDDDKGSEGSFWGDLWDSITDFVGGIVDAIGEAASEVGEAIENVKDSVTNFVTDVVDGIFDFLSGSGSSNESKEEKIIDNNPSEMKSEEKVSSDKTASDSNKGEKASERSFSYDPTNVPVPVVATKSDGAVSVDFCKSNIDFTRIVEEKSAHTKSLDNVKESIKKSQEEKGANVSKMLEVFAQPTEVVLYKHENVNFVVSKTPSYVTQMSQVVNYNSDLFSANQDDLKKNLFEMNSISTENNTDTYSIFFRIKF